MTATSNNYAEALFMLSSSYCRIDSFLNDLRTVNTLFKENPEYTQLLSAPSIQKSDRLSIIDAAFEGKIGDDILSFLKLLCEKGKIAQLPDIVNEFEKLYEWSSKRCEAVVSSAVELDELQKQDLIKALEKRTGKSIVLKTVIDKSILGGLTVTLDGELIDGSVKTNINNIRKVIGSER